MWDKLRKERDHHRMHHRRVVQEKDKLITDLRRLKNHVDGYFLLSRSVAALANALGDRYEPMLKELQRKYELAMKEKMLVRLERDRMQQKVEALEAQIDSLPGATAVESREATAAADQTRSGTQKKRAVRDSVLPEADRENPFLDLDFEPANIESFRNVKTIKGHDAPVAACVSLTSNYHSRSPMAL